MQMPEKVTYYIYDFRGEEAVRYDDISYNMIEYQHLRGGGNSDYIDFLAYCKKYVVYSVDDAGNLSIDVHCVDLASAYIALKATYRKQLLTGIQSKPELYYNKDLIPRDLPNDMILKFGLEGMIAESFANKINEKITPNARYICFSDTHGDVAAYTIAMKLHSKHPGKYLFSLGDAIDMKMDYWNDNITDYEINVRNDFIMNIEEDHQRRYNTFIIVHGNHDHFNATVEPSRVIIMNEKYQIILQHALFSHLMEEVILDPEIIDYKTDKICMYKIRKIYQQKYDDKLEHEEALLEMRKAEADEMYEGDALEHRYRNLERRYNNEVNRIRYKMRRDTYDKLTMDYFLRAVNNEAGDYGTEDCRYIDTAMREAVDNAAVACDRTNYIYNPYVSLGHDFYYFYMAALATRERARGRFEHVPIDRDNKNELMNELENLDDYADTFMRVSRKRPIGIFARIFDTDGAIPILYSIETQHRMHGGEGKKITGGGIVAIIIGVIVMAAIIIVTVSYVKLIHTPEKLATGLIGGVKGLFTK